MAPFPSPHHLPKAPDLEPLEPLEPPPLARRVRRAPRHAGKTRPTQREWLEDLQKVSALGSVHICLCKYMYISYYICMYMYIHILICISILYMFILIYTVYTQTCIFWDKCMITSFSFHCCILPGTWFVPLLLYETHKAHTHGPPAAIRSPGKTHPEWTIVLALAITLCRCLQQTESLNHPTWVKLICKCWLR